MKNKGERIICFLKNKKSKATKSEIAGNIKANQYMTVHWLELLGEQGILKMEEEDGKELWSIKKIKAIILPKIKQKSIKEVKK